LGPSRPNTSPAATSKLIPLTASTSPGYVLRSSVTSIAGPLLFVIVIVIDRLL
jgi:hypothetical protein